MANMLLAALSWALLLDPPASPPKIKPSAPVRTQAPGPAPGQAATPYQDTGTTPEDPPANAQDSAAQPGDAKGQDATASPDKSQDTAASSGPGAFSPKPDPSAQDPVLVSTLPCGLRVIVGQDSALPVAALILAVPSGEVQDPERNPGLVHAMAYAIQMGNRELSPGAALDEVYESGGFAEMAVGVAQTRFEALIPQWSLPSMLRVESERFSTSALSQPIWLKSLQYAAQDRPPPGEPDRALRALAFGRSNLARNGRAVLPHLAHIPLPALASYLHQHFNYTRASLVVVSSQPPTKVLAQIEQSFARVKPGTRQSIAPPLPPTPARQSQVARLPQLSKDTMVLGVGPSPRAKVLATLLCKTLQARRYDDPQAPRMPALNCRVQPSATHPFLQIEGEQASTDLRAVLQQKLSAISQGQADKILDKDYLRVSRDLSYQLSTPLARARHYASLTQWPQSSGKQSYAAASLLGLGSAGPDAATEQGEKLREELFSLGFLQPSAYVLVAPAKKGSSKPRKQDAPVKTGKPVKADKPAASDKTGKPAASAKADSPAKTDKPANTDKPAKSDKPAKTGKPAAPAKTDKPTPEKALNAPNDKAQSPRR